MGVLPLTDQCKIGKGFPYSLPSVGPGADLSVQAISPQVTISYMLPLLSAWPAVTFPAAEHHVFCLLQISVKR